MRRSPAEIIREYGPFPGIDRVGGVTYDGQRIWFAAGDTLQAIDPTSGKALRSIDVAAHAGTAFDGQHLFQIAENRIQKIDPSTGRARDDPAPAGGGDSSHGPRHAWVDTIASVRFTRSIPRPARSFGRSSPTVSSPASRGWTASSGTGRGKATRVS